MSLGNIARCARASQIARNVKNGAYINMSKFANFGSIVEDSIFAQQREADRKLKEIQAKKIKTGNIVNGVRYKEARDSDYHSPRMWVGHKSNAIAKKTFCSITG